MAGTGLFFEASEIAGEAPVGAAGFGGSRLHRVLEIGQAKSTGAMRFGITSGCHSCPSEDTIDFLHGLQLGPSSPQQVIGGGEAMPRDPHLCAEFFTPKNGSLAFGGDARTIHQHIEQDIRVEKNAHPGSALYFMPYFSA